MILLLKIFGEIKSIRETWLSYMEWREVNPCVFYQLPPRGKQPLQPLPPCLRPCHNSWGPDSRPIQERKCHLKLNSVPHYTYGLVCVRTYLPFMALVLECAAYSGVYRCIQCIILCCLTEWIHCIYVYFMSWKNIELQCIEGYIHIPKWSSEQRVSSVKSCFSCNFTRYLLEFMWQAWDKFSNLENLRTGLKQLARHQWKQQRWYQN